MLPVDSTIRVIVENMIVEVEVEVEDGREAMRVIRPSL